MSAQLDDFLQMEHTFAFNQHADQETENYLALQRSFLDFLLVTNYLKHNHYFDF